MSVLNWTEVRPAGDVSLNWGCAAISGDGTHMLVGVGGGGTTAGRLYLSTNSGVSWVEIQPSVTLDVIWYAAAISYTGQYMLVGRSGASGRLYLSTNYGVDWGEIQPAGVASPFWHGAAISDSGQYMFVCHDTASGKCFMSSDYGTNWEEVTPGGNKYYSSCDISADGSRVIVSSYNTGGSIWTSNNYGAAGSWVENSPGVTGSWVESKMSGDGLCIIAKNATFDRIYMSTNFGSVWNLVDPNDQTSYQGGLNYDGSIAVMGRINSTYISQDYGANWTDEEVPAAVWSCDVNRDGRVLVACAISDGGRVWLGIPKQPEKPITPNPPDSDIGTDFTDYTLGWEDGGGATTFDVYVGPSAIDLTLASSAQGGTSLVIPEAYRLAKTVETWYWRVDATNEYGTTTGDVWSFSPYWAPEITAQSSSGEKPLGSGVTLFVTANGIPGPTYQWYEDGSPVSGATSATYVIYPTVNHTYFCRVTNVAGYVDSSDIEIVVVPNMSVVRLFEIPLDLSREDG